MLNCECVLVFDSWEEVLEHEYALRLAKVCRPAVADEAAVDKLSLLPTNWSFSHYEQMSKLLSKNSTNTSVSTGTDLGSVKDFVESLEVSSCSNVSLCTLKFINVAAL